MLRSTPVLRHDRFNGSVGKDVEDASYYLIELNENDRFISMNNLNPLNDNKCN